jgi:phosphatidylserine decarboxylase
MGWFSRIEHPWVRDLSIGTWQLFGGDLNLAEAKKTSFTSLHDCFIRELAPGARPIDARPNVLVSPCDAIVGACGTLRGLELIQAKGLIYTLDELTGDARVAETYRDGVYATLRLTSTMYHRFHAPADCHVREVTFIGGDTYNVNPIALKRLERLYCRNERAVIRLQLEGSAVTMTLVAVAAILVGGIALHCVSLELDGRYTGPHRLRCEAAYARGDEMGYFRHGSTIVVLAPPGVRLWHDIAEGHVIRIGEPLFTTSRSVRL